MLKYSLLFFILTTPAFASDIYINPSTPVVNGAAVSTGNPMPISGSISTSVSGFAPGSSYSTPLSVSNSSSRVALPTGTVVVVYNTGTVAAYVQLGNGSVTATTSNDVIPPGGWMAFTIGANTNLAAITASSTTTLNLSGGSGLATGSGSNGGTVSATQSGVWTVQPGNTANSTPWLTTINQGGNSAPVITANTAVGTDKALEVTVANANTNGSATSANSAPVVIASDQAAVSVKGGAASGAALSGNPVPIAGRGSTSDQTAVSDGQAVVPEMTPNGKIINQPWALTPNLVDGGGSKTDTSALTILAASGSASLKEYLTGLQCGRSDTGTTPITVAISDGTKTRTFVLPNSGSGGGNNSQFTTPISFAANTAVTATFSSGVTTAYCNAEGFYAP